MFTNIKTRHLLNFTAPMRLNIAIDTANLNNMKQNSPFDSDKHVHIYDTLGVNMEKF